MRLKIYQIDAFTDTLFKGNPAAVVPLVEWLSEESLLNIAAENNLSETAFYLPSGDFFEIRWFTPEVEVDLCGHATLSAAHVIFQHEHYQKDQIIFHTKNSGNLTVTKNGDYYTLDFPLDHLEAVTVQEQFTLPFSISPKEVWRGSSDYVLVFEKEEDIINLSFDFLAISKIEARGIIVTAPGKSSDFVSRFFGPRVGVNEDPVTGSAHTSLSYYWSKRLGKDKLTAVQLSKRTGQMTCEVMGNRVHLTGKAVTYMTGILNI